MLSRTFILANSVWRDTKQWLIYSHTLERREWSYSLYIYKISVNVVFFFIFRSIRFLCLVDLSPTCPLEPPCIVYDALFPGTLRAFWASTIVMLGGIYKRSRPLPQQSLILLPATTRLHPPTTIPRPAHLQQYAT